MAGEHHGEVTDPGVVPDEQHARDRRRHVADVGEQHVGVGGVEPFVDLNGDVCWQGRTYPLQRFDGPRRRRAQHEVGRFGEALEVLAESGCGAAPPWCERTVVVSDIGLVPARLGVANQEQAVDGPHPHIVAVHRRGA